MSTVLALLAAIRRPRYARGGWIDSPPLPYVSVPLSGPVVFAPTGRDWNALLAALNTYPKETR